MTWFTYSFVDKMKSSINTSILNNCPKTLQLYFAIHQKHTEHFTQEIIKCFRKTQTLKMLVIFTYNWRETWRTEY